MPDPSTTKEPGSADALARFFVARALANLANRAILERMPSWGLPDAWLVAGCLFQTVWNLHSGRAPDAGIRDYDLFYCDPADLSAAAEQRIGDRVQAACADLGVRVETKNQARVHTWYEAYFGSPCAPLHCAQDGIDRFLVDGTCVGLQPGTEGGLTLYAPDGLEGALQGVLRPNRRSPAPHLYAAKAADYQRRWPWLRVLSTCSEVAVAPILLNQIGLYRPSSLR